MKEVSKRMVILGMILSAITIACSKVDVFLPHRPPDKLPNNIILDWNLAAYEGGGGALEAHPLLASRVNAMTHIAMHDAINAVVPLYEQYAYKHHGAFADPIAAAASAAHTVLLASYPDKKTMLDSQLAASLAPIHEGELKSRGISIGQESGNAILVMRANDGAYQDPVGSIPISTVPGVYNYVPPFEFVFAPFWATMQLFSLETHDQFRSPPPPELNSDVYTKDFNEVKELGELNSTTRTAEQSSYAKFWYEYSDIGWNRIARIVTQDENPGLVASARLFALLNMAIADGYTAGWDSKFYYNFWRPYTAIRAADTDGNDGTTADPDWVSAEVTPPVQDYPSTHSCLGNAAATILYSFFRNASFTMTSTTSVPAGITKSFKSFQQAADENADSRVMAGIHFRFACEAGQEMGDQLGSWTLNNHLKPLK